MTSSIDHQQLSKASTDNGAISFPDNFSNFCDQTELSSNSRRTHEHLPNHPTVITYSPTSTSSSASYASSLTPRTPTYGPHLDIDHAELNASQPTPANLPLKSAIASLPASVPKIRPQPPLTVSKAKVVVQEKKPKFHPILDKVVNIEHVNLLEIDSWLKDHLKKMFTCQYNRRHLELLRDLIIDNLKSEKLPDAKVLQCELVDFEILPPEKIQAVMKELWLELLDQQDLARAKRARLSASTSSYRPSSAKTAGDNDPYHYKRRPSSGDRYRNY